MTLLASNILKGWLGYWSSPNKRLFKRNEMNRSVLLSNIISDMPNTRKDTKIPFLEEYPTDELLGARLPTRSDVFRFFFYLHHVLGKSLNEAALTAVRAAKVFWVSAGIATKTEQQAQKDLIKINAIFKVCSWRIRCIHLLIIGWNPESVDIMMRHTLF